MQSLIAAVLVFSACQPPLLGQGAEPAGSPPVISAEDCPRLNSQLLQLVNAPDPAEFASSAGLEMEDGAVRAVVELAGETMPGIEGVVVERSYANLIQALVPIELLCDLSNDPQVKVVRPPLSAQPAN